MDDQHLLDTVYDPRTVEPEVYADWEESKAFVARPADTPHERTFTIVIPPPNVTGALHLGHALNNTLQDILVRYHRMRGFNTLWQPGTDHAGIATQAVVERRIREQEGKSRHDLGRDELVKRIWRWKGEYEQRIISQLKLMGCSCDWSRLRFTLDEGLAKAVRHQFFKLFADGLIFRGKRLVNWDTQLQTAVSDDEVYHEMVKGHFWHLKYPVINPKPGEPEHVVIATTRPETMLGDTAVAVHPDPKGVFDALQARLGEQIADGSQKECAEAEAKLAALQTRRETHLGRLVQLRDMAEDNRLLMLPLVEREIPLIRDEWADPTKGSGCVKITPAHDPNDYEVGVRHRLPMINVLSPDGTIARIVERDGEVNPNSDRYEGLTFTGEGRRKVLADLEELRLIEEVEDREHEIGHSDRSKHPIEPYLSDQWFVHTGDVSEPRALARADKQPSTDVRTPDLTIGAVLVTWTTYGSWLPGDPRGFVSRTPVKSGSHDRHNLPGEPFDADDPHVLAAALEKLIGDPVRLTTEQAGVVLDSLAETCERHGIELLAVAVMGNHMHVLCQTDRPGRELLQLLKGNASHELNKSFGLTRSPRWWTKSGSTRRIKTGADLTAGIDYVKAQDHPLCAWSFDLDNGEIVARIESARAKARGSFGLKLPDGSHASGLAQAAIDVVNDGRIRIFPDRYAKSYVDWLSEKRDWCISRQLWWGHRISVWSFRLSLEGAAALLKGHRGMPDLDARALELSKQLPKQYPDRVAGRTLEEMPDVTGESPERKAALAELRKSGKVHADVHPVALARNLALCVRADDTEIIAQLEEAGYERDEDVLDTWFSSALWPFSTLGWPEQTDHLEQYYPGSVLITSRDIITNWVARMVMFARYAMGDIPFDHVYIHPKILDGRGETMSKSKGNGVDPVDIIHTHGADALRYTMADMTTETQDIRMPVEYVCPHCGKLTDQALALKAETQRRKSRGEKLERKLQPADCDRVTCAHTECGKEFATQWAVASTNDELAVARETSDKFDIGRNFCNKLWNAARYSFMNLQGAPCEPIEVATLPPEDRWILARLSRTIRRYHAHLESYQFSASIKELREFFWDALCDWYIELTKPRLAAQPQRAHEPLDPVSSGRASAQQVLAFCMDQIIRLFHPTIPFITERLWAQLATVAPKRGLPGAAELSTVGLLVKAVFPPTDGYPGLDDDAMLATFERLQDATRGVRDLRVQCGVPLKEQVTVTVGVPQAHATDFEANAHIVKHMAGIAELRVDVNAKRPPNAGSIAVHGLRIYVHDVSDDDAERERSQKTLATLEKQIAGKQAKLRNEKFVRGAKPDVVEAERGRLTDLLEQQTALKNHLAELDG